MQLKKELDEHLTHEWLHAGQWNLAYVVTIDTFPEHATLLEVVIKLDGSNENEEKEEHVVHLWLPFEHVKVIYPVSTGRGVQATADDLKTQDPQKYVEITDDHLKTSLSDVSLPKNVIILVERKRVTSDKDNKAATVNGQLTFPWPLVKGPGQWKNFQLTSNGNN
ncbi:hypothetical protein RFI_31350 [Reticulomyxa filosa]|uniref:Uncharacterized protein n=1 Tax=Reticulomyxa filosa TaxID=46433 RepID=X6LZ81_RETFI|nr:hypothetical protein RFI_31350 [Reticulomyxa filosa]|eukprot:ETO06045.1 hypothetical protein RFI_31350 [Reticulomyxa filosa]